MAQTPGETVRAQSSPDFGDRTQLFGCPKGRDRAEPSELLPNNPNASPTPADRGMVPRYVEIDVCSVSSGWRCANALVGEPGVHLVVVFEPQPRREEAFTDQPDLVLDLPLLPTRCRRAGDRVGASDRNGPAEAAGGEADVAPDAG